MRSQEKNRLPNEPMFLGEKVGYIYEKKWYKIDATYFRIFMLEFGIFLLQSATITEKSHVNHASFEVNFQGRKNRIDLTGEFDGYEYVAKLVCGVKDIEGLQMSLENEIQETSQVTILGEGDEILNRIVKLFIKTLS